MGQPGCPGGDYAYQNTQSLELKVAENLGPRTFPGVEKPCAEQPPPPWSAEAGGIEGPGGPLQRAELKAGKEQPAF